MLTVVIPSYQHEKYIFDCLAAASSISIEGLKILIIDDGSKDKTIKKCLQFIDENRQFSIKLIEKENSGLVSSLNLALDLIDTQYMYICASDDIPVAKGIEYALRILEKDSAIMFYIGGAISFDDETGKQWPSYNERHLKFFMKDFSKNVTDLFINYPAPLLLQSTVFKVDALRSIGGWDSTLKLDDYPTFVKLLMKYDEGSKKKFIFDADNINVRYRHHGNNTYSKIGNQFLMVSQAIDKLAPSNLKNKAIGLQAAYYFLQSLRSGQYRIALNIFRSLNIRCKVFFPIYLNNVILRYFSNESI